MTSVDLKEAAAAYEAASQYFLNLARAVTPDLLDVHAENEWSARQCIHHMADSEAQSYARLRRLVAEPDGSVIQGYDEAAWANEPKLAYADGAVENAIAVFVGKLSLLNHFKSSVSNPSITISPDSIIPLNIKQIICALSPPGHSLLKL